MTGERSRGGARHRYNDGHRGHSVDYHDLPVPEMANSAEVKIGQTAIAM